MKLRTAIKICKRRFVHRNSAKDKHLSEHFDIRYGYGQVRRALAVCRRNRRDVNDRRCQEFPSDHELDEQAEVQFCILTSLARALGAPEETIDKAWEDWEALKHEPA